MQTPFITDWRAKALTPADAGVTAPAISIQYHDHLGRPAGTSIILATDLAEQARALLAMAEAATLHAHGADGVAKPPRHHFPIMRDVRVADAA
ncbi:hypothetical protein [Sphingomonas sp. Leaf4]|uniref:hypothetical protein n=1 Tax=Sphingomonas sp. Leaf4 TaxID=2876553 RepID=UPI001E6235C2|nr:hypothetical protein [Sphingomonas sp. Leaf4]